MKCEGRVRERERERGGRKKDGEVGVYRDLHRHRLHLEVLLVYYVHEGN
jgi:hypothetical protein